MTKQQMGKHCKNVADKASAYHGRTHISCKREQKCNVQREKMDQREESERAEIGERA